MSTYRVEFHSPCRLGTALVTEKVTTDHGPAFALDVVLARYTDRRRYMVRPLTILDIDRATVRSQEETR
jgi:hypothetical protein